MQPSRLRGIARAYLASIAFWCGMSLLMGLQYYPIDYQHLWSSLGGLLTQAGARAAALALWTPPIFFLVARFLPYAKNRVRYVLMWTLGAPVYVVLHTGLFWLIIPPYDDALHKYVPRTFQYWIDTIRAGFAEEIFIYIAIVVAAHGYEYLKRVRRQEADRYEYQQALAASELQALKMQLHPHFLFNTLHGIATLVEEDGRKAKAMILKLSDLLRTAMDRDSSDLIPMEMELRFAREYLELEKMRFGNRLQVEWLIAPGTERLLVPQMILQPIIENAIRHGIASSREGGWIEVRSSTGDERLRIEVRNSNSSAPTSSCGTGLGMRNVEARLRYLFADDASVRLSFS
ncbi:MAG TPA: histidine kinase, partial [Ktedonobacterales bacterium]|nr:histidine kinase [Ktedonobacterales bacterium]